MLRLQRARVQDVIDERDEEVAYRRLAPRVADNVEQQWKLAQWCRERYLTDEREVHLRRILQLDPDHLPARRALGYSQVEGEWLTRDQWRRRQGYEYYRGRWRLPQEIEFLKQHHQRDRAEKQWLARIRNWREKLLTDEGAEARDALLGIEDPHAVAALAEFLHQDRLRAAKLIYITTLTKIGDAASVQALLTASLHDPDEEIRVACLDAIEQLDPPGAVTQYVNALGDANNHVVNRAAYALARLGDESVVAPLIDALVTSHTFTLKSRPHAGPDTITTSFVNDQRAAAANAPPLMPSTGTNFAMGQGEKSVTRRIPNEEVLTALLRLSNAPNYGYNRQAWLRWLESQQQAAALDGRRR